MDIGRRAGVTGPMRKGPLASLRNMRRWFAQAVVLAVVLPALIGLLPQPALSETAALARDVMISVCGQDLPQQPDGGSQHKSGHDHCVLCGTQCLNCSPSLASAGPAFAAMPRQSAIPVAAAASTVAPPLQALLDASPPRGPPAA